MTPQPTNEFPRITPKSGGRFHQPVRRHDPLRINIVAGRLDSVRWVDAAGETRTPLSQIIETVDGMYVCWECGEPDQGLTGARQFCQWCKEHA